LREQERREQDKKLGSPIRRLTRACCATVYRTSVLDFVNYIWVDGRSPGTRYAYITDKEFTNSIAITILSFGIFGIGIGQAITEMINKW